MGALDYVNVLTALNDIPFSVGKKLLTSFLRGEKHESIERHKLNQLSSFGLLSAYEESDIDELIEMLLLNKFVERTSIQGNAFVKVYKLTDKGQRERIQPSLKQLTCVYDVAQITAQDRQLFHAFDFFLKPYNDYQKKAITSSALRILCIAGAGSGKTTTLTKRIEFLVRYRSVPADKILAITFTRKARQEMEKRLLSRGITVHVQTFNSFSEQQLHQHGYKIYDRPMHVLSYSDKMRYLQSALKTLNKSLQQVFDAYYSSAQRKAKTDAELFYDFVSDCFTVIEHQKIERKSLADLSKDNSLTIKEKASALLIYQICTEIEHIMTDEGCRDYTDQILHTLQLFYKHPDVIPQYEHILVDEYQDVNTTQIELLNVLNSPHLFCVGDPRQSIFGWRGSRVEYILDFQKRYKNCEVISLVKNYRSAHSIVELINTSIKNMRLPSLDSMVADSGTVQLVECDSEEDEYSFVAEKLHSVVVPAHDIFILARTHRQLKELSLRLQKSGIRYIIRSEDNQHQTAQPDEITLATVHAIKGMEADTVFVLGCSGQNFPCKASDHPIIDLVKQNDYDRTEEERRLFYVALSRAKKTLVMTYHGSLTKFVTLEVQRLLQATKHEPQKPAKDDAFERLRVWRKNLAKEMSVPPYVILHDSVLLEITIRKPETLDELLAIKGMGPAKLMKYGEQILSLL